jgi:outer membrane receptor for ferrienterochelin and colicins
MKTKRKTNRRWKLFAISGVVALAVSFMSHASDQAPKGDSAFHEDIVVTAILTSTDLKSVPGSTEVITSEEIELKGSETVADALEDALGVVLTFVPGRGMVPQIRGLADKRTLVLINGMRLSTDFRDTAIDLTLYSTEIIERIEVVRGPTSALYGSDAMGGVINIITKEIPETPSGGATLRYGQNSHGELGTPTIRSFFGDRVGKFGYQLMAHYNEQDPYDIEIDDGFTDFDEEQRRFVQLDLAYFINDDQKLSAGLHYSRANRIGLRFKNGEETDRDADSNRDGFHLQYDGHFSTGDLMIRGYHSVYEMDRSYIGRRVQEYFNIENKLTQYEARFSGFEAGTHLLSFGAEYRDENRNGRENRSEQPSNYTIDNHAVFVQDQWSLSERVVLTAGLRYDDSSDFGSVVTPRLAGVFSFKDNLRIKAYYGEGFRSPSVYELYVETVNNRENVLPNPDLEAEQSQSYELSLEGESRRFSGAVRLFCNDLEDAIEKVYVRDVDLGGPRPTPQYIRLNVESAFAEGVEIEGQYLFPPNFRLVLNGIVMDSENELTGERLFNVPDYKANIRLEYNNPDNGWRSAIRLNFIGDQVASMKGTHGTDTDAYSMVHLYLAKSVSEHFRLFVGIDNLFDTELDHMSEAGTFFYGGISISFQ